MPKTLYNEHTYPSENQDPFYSTIKSFFDQNDLTMFSNKIRSNFILAGGGTLTWDYSTGLFSWTSDFALKHLFTGFLVKYVYGDDGINREINLQDGDILYGLFPSSLSANRNYNLVSATSIPKTDNVFVLGWRYENNLYLQNGLIL